MILSGKQISKNKVYSLMYVHKISRNTIKRLEKEGITSLSKIRLIDITSYGFYLLEITHPNGTLIKTFIDDKEIDGFYVEEIEDYN